MNNHASVQHITIFWIFVLYSLYLRYQDIYFEGEEFEAAFAGVKANKVYDSYRRQTQEGDGAGGINSIEGAGESNVRPAEPDRQDFLNSVDRVR